MFNTQSRLLQADWLISENNEKATLNINMSYGFLCWIQAYVQTNEDNLDRDIQTEDIETEEKWCQHPPEGAASSGGDNSNNTESSESSAASKVDDVKLSSFLQRACQVW